MKLAKGIACALLSASLFRANALAQEQAPALPKFAHGDSVAVRGVEIFDRIVYFPVTVNGKGPLTFVLDTGAGELCAIDDAKANELGFRSKPIGQGGGAGEERVTFGLADSMTIALPGLAFENRPLLVFPVSRMDVHWGKRKDGMFGGDLLSTLVTEIDYARERVVFHDAAKYEHPGPGETIPIFKFGNYLMIEAKVLLHGSDKPVDAVFLLDTGVRITTFNAPFAAKHALAAQSPRTLSGVSGFGVGGLSKGTFGRVRGLSIGPFTIDEPVVSFSTDTAGAFADSSFSGILGADFLSRFTLVLDYARSRISLRPNGEYDAPSEFDMLGVRFSHEGDAFDVHTVFSVYDGSPAAEAGLAKGDVLVSIDGRDAKTFTREDLRGYFQREGETVRLAVRRGGATREVALRLRRLV